MHPLETMRILNDYPHAHHRHDQLMARILNESTKAKTQQMYYKILFGTSYIQTEIQRRFNVSLFQIQKKSLQNKSSLHKYVSKLFHMKNAFDPFFSR